MQQTQVIPAYVNYPKKQGGKYGNIKLDNGAVYWVPANYLNSFQQGQSANITYGMQTWGNMGQVLVVTGINGQDITGQQGPIRGGDRPAPQPQNVPQSDKEEGMFVMGVVGRAMGSGQFGISDIDILTWSAVKAWRDRHKVPQTIDAGPPNQAGWIPPTDEMPDQTDVDDEIPF